MNSHSVTKALSPLRRYGAAALFVAGACLLTRALWPWVAPHPTPLFLAAVMLAAFYGGRGASLLATALAARSKGIHRDRRLGLSIVRHIVEAHGGGVTADSAGEGRGATFTVTLPLAGASRAGAADADGRAAGEGPGQGSLVLPPGPDAPAA